MTDPEIVVLRLPLSYNLKSSELNLEPRVHDVGDADEAIAYIAEYLSPNDEVLERIFRHAIILFHSEKGTFGECLNTALTWEVG